MNTLSEKIDNIFELGGIKKKIVFLIISGISLIISLFNIEGLPFDMAWVAIILCGLPIIIESLLGFFTSLDIKEGFLVSIALIASISIGEFFAAGEVALIMQLGEMLEERTVAKTRAGIEGLVKLTPRTARIFSDNDYNIVPVENVKLGDKIRVLPGESIPVDGVILSGTASINEAILTGEAIPIDKFTGDTVSSGTINQFGAFEMEATKLYKDSSIQKMIDLVKSADANKSKIVRFLDKWSTLIVVIALLSSFFTWIFTGEVIRAVTILVVFCPCSMVLSAPTAITAAIGNATKHGFLVKDGDTLEKLSKISKITFDKTGTLTVGTPKVTCVQSVSKYTHDEIYKMAVAVEQFSEHPLGKAIVNSYTLKENIPTAQNFKMTAGVSVSANVDGIFTQVGSDKIITEEVPQTKPYRDEGSTIIYVKSDHKLVGFICLSDTLKEESHNAISQIKKLGIKTVLLTGDHKNVADIMGKSLGIDEIHSQCLPEDKLNYINSCQEKNENICMIGDGINDAPSMKKADVGIAMGKIGSDITIDAADITLVNDNIKELPHLLSLSRRMMNTIKINLSLSMILNFLSITLAIIGILNPVVGALVHNAGSILVVLNSVFLLKYKKKR